MKTTRIDEIKIGDVPVDLLRETLTDGSHVWNVRVKANDGHGLLFEMDDEKSARALFELLSSRCSTADEI